MAPCLTRAPQLLPVPQLFDTHYVADVNPAVCPDYPYCTNFNGFLPVPAVPGAGEVIAAQEAIIRSHQGVGVPALPGLEVRLELQL